MTESDEEVWLERDDFMTEFCIDSIGSLKNFENKGLHRKKTGGGKGNGMPRYIYPKYANHRWFAGENLVKKK